MASFTPNYDLEKPVVGGDLDVWGGKLNTNFDKVDTAIKARADQTSTVASNLATLDAAVVKKDGSVQMTGPLLLPAGNPTLNTHATNKSYVDNALSIKAPLNSPALTGTPTSTTAAAGTNTTQIATTAFVATAVSNGVAPLAPIASPVFSGTPTAPTASTGTNNTQIATTQFVTTAASNAVAPINYWIRLVKSATSTIVSNITYANDANLQFAVVAGRKYTFRATLFLNPAGSIKITTAQPATSLIHLLHQTTSSTGFATASFIAAQATLYLTAATANAIVVKIEGIIQPSANGTFAIQAAQNSSSTTASGIKLGSYLEYIDQA